MQRNYDSLNAKLDKLFFRKKDKDYIDHLLRLIIRQKNILKNKEWEIIKDKHIKDFYIQLEELIMPRRIKE